MFKITSNLQTQDCGMKTRVVAFYSINVNRFINLDVLVYNKSKQQPK